MNTGIWYRAEDQFDDKIWYNYFLELDKDSVKYYSIETDDKYLKDFQYIEESTDDLADMLENYELEETNLKHNDIIKACFGEKLE